MGSVGIDFGEDEDSGGFEYHKLTDQQLKCKYTHIYLHMFTGTTHFSLTSFLNMHLNSNKTLFVKHGMENRNISLVSPCTIKYRRCIYLIFCAKKFQLSES